MQQERALSIEGFGRAGCVVEGDPVKVGIPGEVREARFAWCVEPVVQRQLDVGVQSKGRRFEASQTVAVSAASVIRNCSSSASSSARDPDWCPFLRVTC